MRCTTFPVVLVVLLAFSLETKAEEEPSPSATDDTPESGVTGDVSSLTGTPVPLTNEDPCANFTGKDECCSNATAVANSCTFCAASDTPEDATCLSTCDSPKEDLCSAPGPVVDPCANFIGKDECCSNETAVANSCTFCAASDTPEDAACSSTCDSPKEDLCSAPGPVLECSNFTVGADCCTFNCSFCINEAGDGVCVDQGMCGDQGVENCTAPDVPTTQTPVGPTGSSEAPTTDTTPKQSTGGDSSGQHFDGASFIGGIILCGGLVALVFFGLKFYKARKEQNYHTL